MATDSWQRRTLSRDLPLFARAKKDRISRLSRATLRLCNLPLSWVTEEEPEVGLGDSKAVTGQPSAIPSAYHPPVTIAIEPVVDFVDAIETAMSSVLPS